MPQYGYTYILASKGKRLSIGITTQLEHMNMAVQDQS